MGGQIRRGRIWRFWGAPVFSPEVPKYLFSKGFGTSGRKIGAPRKTKPNSTTTGLTPHLRPSEVLVRGEDLFLHGLRALLLQNFERRPPTLSVPWSKFVVFLCVCVGGGKLFYLQLEPFCLQLSLFAYSLSSCLLDALLKREHKKLQCKRKSCKSEQKNPIVSKKAPKHNCKQRSSIVSRKIPTVIGHIYKGCNEKGGIRMCLAVHCLSARPDQQPYTVTQMGHPFPC